MPYQLFSLGVFFGVGRISCFFLRRGFKKYGFSVFEFALFFIQKNKKKRGDDSFFGTARFGCFYSFLAAVAAFLVPVAVLFGTSGNFFVALVDFCFFASC